MDRLDSKIEVLKIENLELVKRVAVLTELVTKLEADSEIERRRLRYELQNIRSQGLGYADVLQEIKLLEITI